MEILILTLIQALALHRRINTAEGYPRVPTDSDRIGTGVFCDHASAATRRLQRIIRAGDGRYAYHCTPRVKARLSAAERLAIVTADATWNTATEVVQD